MFNQKQTATPVTWHIPFLFVVPPLLWAGNFIVGKAVSHTISPVTLTFGRWLTALLLILPFALPHMKRDVKRYMQHAGLITTISLSGVTMFSLLVYIGLHHTSGTNALLLNSCVPVLIMLFAAVFFGQRLSIRQVTGLLISCCGVLLIIFRGDIRGLLLLKFSSGDLLLLAAMACFALYTLWLRKIPAEINRIGLLAVQIVITLSVIFPLLLWEKFSSDAVILDMKLVAAVLFLGIFPSVLSYLLYGRCIETIGASRAGLSIHLIPVFGVVLSLIFLDETLHFFHLAGITTILTGVLLASSTARS